MLVLALTACSILHGAECREFSQMMDGPDTPYTCMLGGQQLLADWSRDNPNWRISRWQCVSYERFVAKS